MEQLLCHLWGDYILQSDWAANNKTSKSFSCLWHVVLYGLPFLLLSPSWTALAVIVGTHFIIDRWRLAKYLVYAKNFLAPPSAFDFQTVFVENEPDGRGGFDTGNKIVPSKYAWENCKNTGYPSETPPFLAVWLMIFADNILHLTINYLALGYL